MRATWVGAWNEIRMAVAEWFLWRALSLAPRNEDGARLAEAVHYYLTGRGGADASEEA